MLIIKIISKQLPSGISPRPERYLALCSEYLFSQVQVSGTGVKYMYKSVNSQISSLFIFLLSLYFKER